MINLKSIGMVAVAALSYGPGRPDVKSGFDRSSEDWHIVTYPVQVYTKAPKQFGLATWVKTGGNPDGYIHADDVETNTDTFFSAPEKFLGNDSAFYGGMLTYDLNDLEGNEYLDEDAVVLRGGGLVIVFASKQIPSKTLGKFTHFVIPLKERGWTLNQYKGKPVTAREFKRVLSHLTELSIRCEYHTGPDNSNMDNVALTKPKPPRNNVLTRRRKN